MRGKQLPAGELETLAAGWVDRLATLAPHVIVNDRPDVALAAKAHGAHLGAGDLAVAAARRATPPEFLLGASTHGRDELLAAQKAGADYAGLGAFHPTGTKPSSQPLDLDRAMLRMPVEELTIPVLAIGGLDATRVTEALRVPAVTGVAVSAAIQSSPDPEGAIDELRGVLEEAWKARGVT